MYYLLFFHSVFRWLVLVSLCYAIYIGITGYKKNKPFTPWYNTVRHSTATIAHIQLVIGCIMYFSSPLIAYFWQDVSLGMMNSDMVFFGLMHMILMSVAVVIITLGSALAKRKESDKEKHRAMAVWFCIALIIILISIPWPFSPLAERPYIRPF